MAEYIRNPNQSQESYDANIDGLVTTLLIDVRNGASLSDEIEDVRSLYGDSFTEEVIQRLMDQEAV